jgi:hypothetical protein
MRTHRTSLQTVEALAGYAADARGNGVAYVRLAAPTEEHLLRIPFSVRRGRDLNGREVGYGALAAIAGELRKRGVRKAAFRLEDSQLIEDLDAHRDVPEALVLPYVRLRCVLNQFADHSLLLDNGAADLAQRARAEVALHVAA